MTEDNRLGRQTPTQSVVLPYRDTLGNKAVELYNQTGRTAQEWQELQLYDIMALDDKGLWAHMKYGYAVPRRNGKNEIVAMRELYGILHGEHILHTAHRTSTSHSAWERLCDLLNRLGYEEVLRPKKGEQYPKGYTSFKQYGLENVKLLSGEGVVNFRTRSSKGGLGEGYDTLIIDEAQEYTDDQESALKYVVSAAPNPQTIFCGTPPTPVSSGTVFTKMRANALSGGAEYTGWAEWSLPDMTTDIRNRDLWYETNPSMGTILTERDIVSEIGEDEVDFNIQRLGVWIRYNQKSAISKTEWESLQLKTLPKLKGKLFVGIKYGHDGSNVAVSIAVKTASSKIFVESIDCRSTRDGSGWILDFLRRADVQRVVVDGQSGQQLLADEMKAEKLGKPILPTVREIIVANAAFEKALYSGSIRHMEQPSLTQAVSNCEKRSIGANGGFGYKAIRDSIAIELLDSVILAHWACAESKERRKQKISY